jgi:hypothetical protein
MSLARAARAPSSPILVAQVPAGQRAREARGYDSAHRTRKSPTRTRSFLILLPFPEAHEPRSSRLPSLKLPERGRLFQKHTGSSSHSAGNILTSTESVMPETSVTGKIPKAGNRSISVSCTILGCSSLLLLMASKFQRARELVLVRRPPISIMLETDDGSWQALARGRHLRELR